MQPINAQAPTLAPTASVAQAPTAPTTREVEQAAAPAGFDILQYATHKQKAESSSSRKSPWECTAVELRERVTFRDVQAVSKRIDTEYHLRAFLSPKPLDMSVVLGNNEDGPINTIIVPAQYAEATKEQFMERVVKAGLLDNHLLEVAEQLRKDKEERDAAPKKAPVDTASADAALADLELAQNPVAQAPVAAAAPAMQAPVQAQAAVAAPAATQAPAMPAGIPGIPTL